jgi:hypothetical protein
MRDDDGRGRGDSIGFKIHVAFEEEEDSTLLGVLFCGTLSLDFEGF